MLFLAGESKGQTFVVFLTSGTSWTVPGDFNPNNNSIEAIGGGGGGAAGTTNNRGGGGGGGGEYRKIVNFSTTPGSNISYAIGSGGGGGSLRLWSGAAGRVARNAHFNEVDDLLAQSW